MKKEMIWMPHAGHFILGDKCRFHLNTYTNGFIISTVGELWNERSVREIHARFTDKKWFIENQELKGDYFDSAYFKRFNFDEIGNDRLYETMVFKAKKSKHKCCPYQMKSGTEQDFESYKDAESAYKGHLKMCLKYNNLRKDKK